MGGAWEGGGHRHTKTKLRWWHTVHQPSIVFARSYLWDMTVRRHAETKHCGLVPEGHATVARAEHYRNKVHKPVAVNAALGK